MWQVTMCISGFFFSSRRRHTRSLCDWSSDVCSSDLAGFSYPAGFPKGVRSYTTPKVIVARAFAPPTTHWKYARRPYDRAYSDHATHVAGIAAGDYNTRAEDNR